MMKKSLLIQINAFSYHRFIFERTIERSPTVRIGKVIGSIWATRKNQGLDGFKLMVVHILDAQGQEINEMMVAIDDVGAGVGDTVLLASGSAARMVCTHHDIPVDLAIVGIVDDLDIINQ